MTFTGLSKTEKIGNYTRKYIQAKCDCGHEFWIRKDAQFKTKSCGCLQRKKVSEANVIHKTKHGIANKHQLYATWKNMKARCLQKNHRDFKHYGGRGITVCEEWLNDFMAFYNWAIKNGYLDNLSIDRIDNNKGYYPQNCRWANVETQRRNTRILRKNNTSGYRGVYFVRKTKKWSASIRVNKKQNHIGVYSDPKEAATAYDTFVIVYGLQHTTNFPKGVFA